MSSADIFSFKDYRSYLSAWVEAQESNWGLWSRMAEAAGCRPTYLTQVMKGKAELTPDHALGIAQSLKLSEAETEFFFLLVEHARAGTKNLKDHLHAKMQKIRREREDLSKRLAFPKIEITDKAAFYYSSWIWSALHVLVSIPQYQTAEAIARRLSMPREFVEYSLQRLAEHDVIKREGQRWVYKDADLFIPKASPLSSVHQNNWRQRAVQDFLQPTSDGVHFTAVYSMSLKDYQHLKEKMLELIEHSRKVVTASKEEEMVGFLCDIFIA